MTKKKVFLGLFAVAGAVAAGIMMKKKRGVIKVEGELEAGHKPEILGDTKSTVQGSATVRATGNRQPQH